MRRIMSNERGRRRIDPRDLAAEVAKIFHNRLVYMIGGHGEIQEDTTYKIDCPYAFSLETINLTPADDHDFAVNLVDLLLAEPRYATKRQKRDYRNAKKRYDRARENEPSWG